MKDIFSVILDTIRVFQCWHTGPYFKENWKKWFLISILLSLFSSNGGSGNKIYWKIHQVILISISTWLLFAGLVSILIAMLALQLKMATSDQRSIRGLLFCFILGHTQGWEWTLKLPMITGKMTCSGFYFLKCKIFRVTYGMGQTLRPKILSFLYVLKVKY